MCTYNIYLIIFIHLFFINIFVLQKDIKYILICNSNSHSKFCPEYRRDNRLKGTSNPKIHSFNLTEINILSKTLEIMRYYIANNKDRFQQTNDFLNEINQALGIIS